MHHHRGRPAERSLIRDLTVLQRTRSLRDPSTSPPTWLSHSIVGNSTRKQVKGSVSHSQRRLDFDRGNELERSSASPSRFVDVPRLRVTAAVEGSSSQGIIDGVHDGELPMRKEPRSKKCENPGEVSARYKSISPKTTSGENIPVQLEAPVWKQNENRKVSNSYHPRSQRKEKRERKQSCKGVSTMEGMINPRYDEGCGSLVAASNSVPGSSVCHRCYVGDANEKATFITQGSRNGFWIPRNWSRIHHRDKAFRDAAGMSSSHALSNSRLMAAESPVIQRRGSTSYTLSGLDHLSISKSSNSEVLPILTESPISQNRSKDCFWEQLRPGKHGGGMREFEIVSEQSSGNQQRSEGDHCSRYLSLMEKYMPRTFKNIVGQNLVVQVLANAVSKRKIGSIYVFYGPHGTGKTSCARLFAKALSCYSVETSKPCDVCTSCISHNLGKSRDMLEVGPVGKVEFERIMVAMDNMVLSSLPSDCKVFIIDDCDKLPPDSWITISKVIDRAPQYVVFLLVCSKLDLLPHVIRSRCQKLFFPKLKDADIIYALERISTSEGLEIEKDVFKLIASSADGSLRDAMMTLDQLSLLEQRISLPLVEELVGSISSEKLVDLLDSALSADSENTLKSLRAITETRVDPVAVLSQLAVVITDIFAGKCVLAQERPERNFFGRPTLSKADMEKLRQALKILTQAEKRLQSSSDKFTCLASSLLQLTSVQQYMLPSFSLDNISDHSRKSLHDIRGQVINGRSFNRQYDMLRTNRNSDTPTTDPKYRRTNNNRLKQDQLAGDTPNPPMLSTEVKCMSNSEVCSGSENFLRRFPGVNFAQARKEIIELEASHQGCEDTKYIGDRAEDKGEGLQNALMEESSCSQHQRRASIEQPQGHSLMRSKASLADLIKQSKVCAPRGGWPGHKMISISEKLEHDKLYLARSLFCWGSSGHNRWKGSHLRMKLRKRRSMVKFVICGRFLCPKSLRAY